MTQVDVVVIGSGQGGVPFAADMALEGKRVVLFERDKLGGSCINYGCTPSKAFLAAAHSAGRARQAAVLGVRAHVEVDFTAVMERVESIRSRFENGIGEKLAGAGVQVVRAQASFAGPREVEANGERYAAPLVVIDTGTTAFLPPIPGLAGTPYLTNHNFFQQRMLPTRTIVFGGGYIGLELGQGLARCGSEVHVIDRNDRALAREEPDATETLEASLANDGVVLHLRRIAKSVEYDAAGFRVTLNDGAVLHGDALLVAVGRQPNTQALNAAAAGVELDERGTVKTDEHLQTTCAGTYAIGDVSGQPAFTHVSWEDYRRLKAILAGEPRTRDDRVLAYTTFTEPQIARVGLTLEQAHARGFDARAVTLPASRIARAVEWGQESGFYRLVVDRANDRILGATMCGYEAGEFVHVILAHMEAGSTWETLERSVHIHPTYCEGLPSLARLLK